MQLPASTCSPTSTNTTSCSETNMISSPVWKKSKYTSSSLPGSAPDNMKSELRTKLSELTPTQLFEQLFTPDMFDLMARETQRYARHVRNDVDFVTSADEMRAFVGILLLSGYNIRSSEKDYWSEADDLKAECVQNMMPKNRYVKLKASVSRPPTVLDNVRYDGVGHLIQQRSQQTRCQRDLCTGKPTYYCCKCNITLCPACFHPYHTR